jgi:L-alanine-DL-glutamate epimerase-like enolase superfamily enzyme
MLHWHIEQRRLDLNYVWNISRGASTQKINSIISVSGRGWQGIGEAAPNIRYNETPELLQSEFARFADAGASRIQDLDDLDVLLTELKLPNALRFGIESAYIHYLCHSTQTDIYTFLGVPKPGRVATSFSLPIMDPAEIAAFFRKNRLDRFSLIKVKINTGNGVDVLAEVAKLTSASLIIDANEAWNDANELLAFLNTLHKNGYPVRVIEQPMRAAMRDEYSYVKPLSPFPLFADESICSDADFTALSRQFHGINMKLMKAGGYRNGLRLLRGAKDNNMRTMIGCMIETTLGISSAYHLCSLAEFADLDGFLIVKDEPFGLLREEDGLLSLTI